MKRILASLVFIGCLSAFSPVLQAHYGLVLAEERSPEWRHLQQEHLKKEPVCQWCGTSKHLQVHHIIPFHLRPDLELDPNNLITLCEGRNKCHLKHGHLGNFRNYNPHVREDCERHKKERSKRWRAR